jgi:hypothetical protein
MLPQSNPPSIVSLFAVRRGPIAVAYTALGLEGLARLAQPLALGLAINGLLTGSYLGLLGLVAQHVAQMATAAWRRARFAAAFRGLAAHWCRTQSLQAGNDPNDSQATPAGAPLRAAIESLERRIPDWSRAVSLLVGSVAILAWFDPWVSLCCITLVVPATVLRRTSGRSTLALAGRLFDQFDQDGADRSGVESVPARRSTAAGGEALPAIAMELLVLAFVAAALVRACTLPGVAAGDIVAVLRYAMLFVAGLDSLPVMARRLPADALATDSGISARLPFRAAAVPPGAR